MNETPEPLVAHVGAARQADPRALDRQVYDRQRLVDEYRGDWVVDPTTVAEIPTDRCPVCGTPAAGYDSWAEHMADHKGEALSWWKRWHETHPATT
ncbi:hypothetical protein ACWFMI_24905 [Nocardiopsis terrae]|uniref:hypothetical protein n=1 Tax=Streptomyces sp. NPDC057554 TaxID=3350538 RepID=UPI0036CAFAA0